MTEKKELTLGSLFDGSGGFPLGGILAGVRPVWASEIEPFPVLVTHRRLPDVKHYGDVSKLRGSGLEPVDIITFGSPCQDLSIAGRRAGIHEGQRSSLFFQAIRIIKEMREATDGRYPRYCVFENVTGALSSNGGEDFRAVLEAVIGVREEGAEVPPPADHRWPKADVYLGGGWSVAYRVLDTQYWSVPQRRARIYLVADFAGESAPEVLFKSEGVSGYTPQGFRAWEGTAPGAEKGPGEAGRGGSGEAGREPDAGGRQFVINPQGCSGLTVTEDRTGTLVAQDHGNHPVVLHPAGVPGGVDRVQGSVDRVPGYGDGVQGSVDTAPGDGGDVLQAAGFSTEHSAKARSIGYGEEISPTLRAGVVPAAMLFDNHPQDCRYDGPLEDSPTVTARYGTGGNTQPLVAQKRTFDVRFTSEGTRNARGNVYETDTARTLDTGGNSPDANQGGVAVVESTGTAEGIRAGARGSQNNAGIKAYGVCSKSSHSMLSDNPHSGFYEAETSRTLDRGGGNPTCAQGGICIVAPAEPAGFAGPSYSIQGSMVGRAVRNGPQGSGINEEVAFTLNTADRHCVAAPAVPPTGSGGGEAAPPEDAGHYSTSKNSFFMHPAKEQANTLVATDYKDPPILNDMPNDEPVYIVRRLTPVECARLQGFPDWWCADLADPHPSPDEMSFWQEVWGTWNAMNGKKPKTDRQIRKWLAGPHTDAAEYKLWGNGVSLPIVYFVLSGIAWAAGRDAG